MVELILEMIIGCDIINVNEIDEQIQDLEKQREELEKQRLDALVNEEKAFHCKKCDRIIFTDTATSYELESRRCYRCMREEDDKKKKKEIIEKLQYGKVVEVDVSSLSTDINSIFIHKNGVTYEIIAVGSDDSCLQIESECKEDITIENEQEIKPYMKKRLEKPLM